MHGRLPRPRASGLPLCWCVRNVGLRGALHCSESIATESEEIQEAKFDAKEKNVLYIGCFFFCLFLLVMQVADDAIAFSGFMSRWMTRCRGYWKWEKLCTMMRSYGRRDKVQEHWMYFRNMKWQRDLGNNEKACYCLRRKCPMLYLPFENENQRFLINKILIQSSNVQKQISIWGKNSQYKKTRRSLKKKLSH